MTTPKKPAASAADEAAPPSEPGAPPLDDMPEAASAPAPGAASDEASPPGGALLELPDEAVIRLEAELADMKDKYLRLAADMDNFRKRMLRERTELWGKAQADIVVRLMDALDDLARFAHVDPAETGAQALHEGVEMVERKFLKELETLGVKRVDQAGVPFDPHVHEAVTTTAAPDPTRDHTVGVVLQAGYKLGDQLLRPARVVVLTWQPAGPA